jgi:integrase
MTMGRPRTKRKDLPPGLYWSERRGFYYYRVLHGETTYVGIGKVNREKAIKGWVKITNSTELNTKAGTFGELIDLFLRAELPRVKSEKTRNEYERQCGKLRQRWGAEIYGQSDADAVARRALRRAFFQRYIRQVEIEDRGHVQANHDVRLAHRIFEIAIQQGLTEYNPVAGVEYIAEAPRKRPLTQAERDGIAAKAAPVFRLMLRLTEATGMRLTDVRLLRVQQIADGCIELSQSKTDNDQRWEITPAVRGILDEASKLPGRAVSMYIFPTRRGTPYSEQGVHHMRRNALTAAGLKNVQFRDIRKAAINEAKKLGRNATEFAGHSDERTTTKHYITEPVSVKPIR